MTLVTTTYKYLECKLPPNVWDSQYNDDDDNGVEDVEFFFLSFEQFLTLFIYHYTTCLFTKFKDENELVLIYSYFQFIIL